MIISEMNVKLTASTSGFARSMDFAGKKVKSFRQTAGKVGAAVRSLATGVGTAAAALAAVAWPTKKMFDLGSEIEETGSKFATVFGSQATGEVSAFLDTFANKAGLTTNEAKALTATTGAIAQGLGFTQEASGQAAIEITKLAGDLSSFNNLPTEETLMAINSALTGEREQLKRLGIVVRETDVTQTAFAQTGKTVAAELTAQEKATATLALITEKAGVAVGDLDRTSGSAANVFRRLVARFKEIRDALATALMPAFRDILGGLEDSEGGFVKLKDTIIENSGLISAWGTLFINVIRLITVPVFNLVRIVFNLGQIVVDATKALFAFLRSDWDEVNASVEDMKTNFGQIDEALYSTGAVVRETIDSIVDVMAGGKEAADNTANSMQNIKIPEQTSEEIETVAAAVEGVRDKVESLGESFIKNFVGRMTTAAQGGKEAFKGFFAYMKKELISLAMKALLFKAIMGVAGKFGWDAGAFAKTMTGFEVATTGAGDTSGQPGAPGAGTPILSGKAASVAGSGMIVNQNINFTVSAIDGRSAARFIKEQGGNIADVIATAAKDSTAYRRQLQGG
jgi:hypothetical protein